MGIKVVRAGGILGGGLFSPTSVQPEIHGQANQQTQANALRHFQQKADLGLAGPTLHEEHAYDRADD
jgi:hypothetical protein